MNVEILDEGRINDFADYCRRHRDQVDDSFLYEEDLKAFEPGAENPTYIITGAEGEILAAASLMLTDYYRRGGSARFRIFHSHSGEIQHYSSLLQAILKHTDCVNSLYLFISMDNQKMQELIVELNFRVYRYSFLLVREDMPVPEVMLPEGYEIRSFRAGLDEEAWCSIRNAAFAKLKGSETPIVPEMVAEMLSEDGYLEGGMLMLYHKEKPVGVIRGSVDEYKGAPTMDIGPLAIIPEYQGMGLGRCLLRASLNFAKENSFNREILCVNAENERAKALYLQEGFKEAEAVVCYRYQLT